MGKAMTFIAMLVMIDIVFIATGVVSQLTINSVLLEAVFNWQDTNVFSWQFFKDLIGDLWNATTSSAGLLATLLASAGVVAGYILNPSDTKLFIPIAAVLAIIGQDFIVVGQKLAQINELLATIVIAPIALLYILTILDWVRGRD